MATTTPNFGWPVPTSTDLVKDGATAIEGLGDAIDASLLDLKGGTTGQVLSKASNTDMDFTWVTDAAGDITGVTAGTGISGGGTSGTVTVTNSMATAIDAKGDLIGGTGADTFSRLAVGANGTVLTADSAEATGLKWATPAAASSFVGVKCFKSAAQSIPNATWTTLTFDSESFDTNAFHDNSTNNSRITIPSGKAGKYSVQWQTVWAGGTGSRNTRLLLNGNNAAYGVWMNALTGGDPTSTNNNALLTLSVGDYLELLIGQGSGGALDAAASEAVGCTFSVTYLGA